MPRIAIVAADYHKEIVEEMISIARKAAATNSIDVVSVVRVSGCFDIPLALKRQLARQDIDAAVVLGAVVHGKTSHDEVVAYTAAEKIAGLSLQFDKPVGYGISGPRMTLGQARTHANEFAVRAVEAVLRTLNSGII